MISTFLNGDTYASVITTVADTPAEHSAETSKADIQVVFLYKLIPGVAESSHGTRAYLIHPCPTIPCQYFPALK